MLDTLAALLMTLPLVGWLVRERNAERPAPVEVDPACAEDTFNGTWTL